METSYVVAGIDVHKSLIAVVLSDVAQAGEFDFERRKFGTPASELRALVVWRSERLVREPALLIRAPEGLQPS